MRSNLNFLSRWLLILGTAILLPSQTYGGAQSRATTVALRADGGPYSIVALRVNGMGPYNFVVDTGSSVTLIDFGLSRELGVVSERSAVLSSVSGGRPVGQATATITVGTITVRRLQMDLVEGLGNGAFGAGVKGVLGENFLGMFDVLLDNQNRRLTLDPDAGLAKAYGGERLPMEQTTNFKGKAIQFRPTVSVVVPSYSSHPLRLILDTGTSALMIADVMSFARSGVADNGGRAELKLVKTPTGVKPCAVWTDSVRWGKTLARQVQIVSCTATEAMDSTGSIPTFLFKRVLISHQGGYVVVNPESRAAGMEVASADPARSN